MDLGLDGKRVLVSGGSRGIGLATARLFAEEGCRLVLVARDQEGLEAARAELPATTDVVLVAADLADPKLARRLADDHPDVDVLVNNAGAIPGGNLLAVDDATWRRAWDLKVLGYVNMSRAFYPRMQARACGVIVNVIGNAAETLDPDYICGVTGNAALVAFTKSLGSTSEGDGIRVLGINPGPVATGRLVKRMQARAAERLGSAERWQELLAPLPFGRAATPDEIAALIAFLASRHSAYTSGTVVTVDGGASGRSATF
ncbi:MAG: SDR family oxidoreductase [Geminicoccaceae bacterium]|nr:MAG: SDR family oxidoreductase [Geminicoccaceae bacterium]